MRPAGMMQRVCVNWAKAYGAEHVDRLYGTSVA